MAEIPLDKWAPPKAPEPKTPGVTVRIEELQPGFWTWNLRLDRVLVGEFYVYAAGPRAHERQFSTPEVAEADCREMLGELVERLTGVEGFELGGLTFVRE